MNTGDTAFMLIATALVFFMTPGLAFFYGGLVRRKKTQNLYPTPADKLTLRPKGLLRREHLPSIV